MRVIDNNLLATFRQKPSCEWCGAATPTGTHPHHLRARGLGGGSRIDHAFNLLASCASCHRKIHDGNIHRPALLIVVARREGVSVECLEDTVNRLLRTPGRPVAAWNGHNNGTRKESLMAEIANYARHPISQVFPEIVEDEWKGYIESFKMHGQQETIWIFENMILDGWHTYKGCRELEIEPKTKVYKGDDPFGFAMARNLHRRHLDASQRAMIAAKIKPMFEEAAEQRRLANLKKGSTRSGKVATSGNGRARDHAAEAVGGVSGRSVQDAQTVLDSGNQELVKAVETGKAKVSDARKRVSKPKTLKQKAANEPADANQSGELVDSIGAVIPAGLVPVFQKAPEFKVAVNQISEIKRTMNALKESRAGAYISTGTLHQITVDLDNAKRSIRFAMPYSVCPVCSGSAKNRTGARFKEVGMASCPCKDKGWLSESAYNAMPQELRA